MAMMMPPPQQQQGGYHHPQTLEEVRTLWIGDLQYWVDENYLSSCFSQTGELVSVKVIRNKITGQPEGYGFIEFVSHAAAERTLQTYNGTLMPGTEVAFRLNWASFGSGQKVDAGPDHSIFVGDLAPDVTDYLLHETFRVHYSSVRGAKVVTDPSTGRSKGYGFVKFADESERNKAMSEMNGLYCSTRPMRISVATPRKNVGVQQQYVTKAAYPVPAPVPSAVAAPAYVTQPAQVLAPENDITCTTVLIANLDPNVTEEELKKAFSPLGEIIYVNIPATKGYGYVQFKTRPSAEEAIQKMQGHVIGQQPVRISWSKNPGQDGYATQADPSQWNAYYGYGQGYDAYAYGAAQDPSLYAYGGYGYPQYPQQGEATQEITNSAAAGVAVAEQELYDPMATPDVEKLNAVSLSVHANAILGRLLWQRTSALSSQLRK
ncbi:Polyadenylate-binding protein RBP47B' [Raphanus sativus]|uniref:Polyadenylate-binding protein RBP47B'-like n=1 Tax=Raphanus sativus TaxID=3726 RepID=A0A9W3CUA3_RAPSA|nr:polyadenylate-binding protein RBP47B'-like [Raphanus sativus]KAJ4869314.1 Polyadenylate-binding protein RBP47B' [Raphanus sativus]